MKRTSLIRRLTAGVAVLAIGLVGAVALSAPANAYQESKGNQHQRQQVWKKSWVKVEGAAECVEGEWYITWTVKNKKRVDAKVHKINREIDGIAKDDVIGGRSEVAGTEVLPGSEVGEVTLEVTLKWGKFKKRAKATVELDENCTPSDGEGGEEPEDLGSWTFDCDVLTITVRHPSAAPDPEPEVTLMAVEAPITFTFTASNGEVAEVTVEPGGEETVQFAASEGLTVTVAIDGEPVELEEPIEITSDAWAELECDEGDEGEGGELPVTGASTALLAAGALVMLALGGGLFLIARRRRVTFTA